MWAKFHEALQVNAAQPVKTANLNENNNILIPESFNSTKSRQNWGEDEQVFFLTGLFQLGENARQLQDCVPGRNAGQIQSHLQKHQQKVQQMRQKAAVFAQSVCAQVTKQFGIRMRVFAGLPNLNLNVIHKMTNYPGQFTNPLTVDVALGGEVYAWHLKAVLGVFQKTFGVPVQLRVEDEQLGRYLLPQCVPQAAFPRPSEMTGIAFKPEPPFKQPVSPSDAALNVCRNSQQFDSMEQQLNQAAQLTGQPVSSAQSARPFVSESAEKQIWGYLRPLPGPLPGPPPPPQEFSLDRRKFTLVSQPDSPSVLKLSGEMNVAQLGFYCECYLTMWLAVRARAAGPQPAVELMLRALKIMELAALPHQYYFHLIAQQTGMQPEEAAVIWLAGIVLGVNNTYDL